MHLGNQYLIKFKMADYGLRHCSKAKCEGELVGVYLLHWKGDVFSFLFTKPLTLPVFFYLCVALDESDQHSVRRLLLCGRKKIASYIVIWNNHTHIFLHYPLFMILHISVMS